jgi:tetratricopeptide (TPR) repeat protein
MAGPELNDFQRGNVALVERRFEEAIASFLKHVSKHPQESADAFAKVAECYMRSNVLVPSSSVPEEFTLVSKGNTRMAEYYYRRALKENPAHIASLKTLAAILPEGSEERLEVIEKLLKVQPDYLLTLELGHWHFKKANDPERAYKWYLEAQKLCPKDREAYDCLQMVCRSLGRMDESAEWKKRWEDIYKRKRRHI